MRKSHTHLGGRRKARIGMFGQRASKQPIESPGYVSTNHAQTNGRLTHESDGEVHLFGATERQLTGEREEQEHGGDEQITTRGDGSRAHHLLGRHEAHRSNERSTAFIRHAVTRIDAGLVSETEVEEHDVVPTGTVCLNENVLGREVAMNDPGGMHGTKSGENLVDDVDGAVDRQRSVLTNDRPEGATLVEFHQDKRSAIGEASVAEDGGDVGMHDAGGESDLAEKPSDDPGIGRVTRVNRLQGQTFARCDVEYGVHDAHASSTRNMLDDELRPIGYMNPLTLGTGGS